MYTLRSARKAAVVIYTFHARPILPSTQASAYIVTDRGIPACMLLFSIYGTESLSNWYICSIYCQRLIFSSCAFFALVDYMNAFIHFSSETMKKTLLASSSRLSYISLVSLSTIDSSRSHTSGKNTIPALNMLNSCLQVDISNISMNSIAKMTTYTGISSDRVQCYCVMGCECYTSCAHRKMKLNK